MDDLSKIADDACETAIREGAEQAEVHVGRGRGFSTTLEKGAIKSTQASEYGWLSIRAFYRGGVGRSHANTLDRGRVRGAATTAAALSRQADPDPDFVSLPGPAPLPEVEGLYDDRIAGLSVADAIGVALAVTDDALRTVPEALVSGGSGVSVAEQALANSLGVRVASQRSYYGIGIEAIIRRGDSVGQWFEHTSGHVAEDFKPQDVGRIAAEGALKYLNARDIPSGDYPVVLGPLASGSIYHSLAYHANAEDMQRNRSYLIGKRGQHIASEVLTITDDALIPRGMGSSCCDSEGVPHRPITIVEDGVLLAYLHNSYTANKAGEPNTGHSVGDGVSPTNVNVALGTRTAAELIAEIDDGIYLAAGGIHADSTTGQFSSTIDFGFKIEKGEMAYPIRNAAMGGLFLDLLANVDAISSDYREEPGSLMPTIRVTSVRVAGSA